MAKGKSTDSGRDPNESAALNESVGEVVSDDVVEPESSLEEDLPGEDLASELPDPGPYEIAADEDEAEELSPEAEDSDPEQLVDAEEAAIAAKSTAPVRRPRSAKAPVKKDAPTRTRKEATVSVTEQRTTPSTFVKQSIAELRKVVWPTSSQLMQYFVVVLIFVLFMIALVGLLDVGFGWLLLKALG